MPNKDSVHKPHVHAPRDLRGHIKKCFALTLTLLCLGLPLCAQQTASLPRSTPEAEGVSSPAIIDFLDAVAASPHELHSFMMLRHGKVVAEGWWNPYRPDLKHTLYSTSKSFTATAVGFAVSEGKLTVDDRVVSFFPDDLPETVSPHLAALEVKDLLSMSVGHRTDPTGPVSAHENWVRAFLDTPIVYEPGTRFLYNSVASHTLSAIVQKVTGRKIIDYLRPRLFEPLGIEGMDWEADPQGNNTGGWGLRLKTEDMAKFGQLFLQRGRWQGRQILPETWIEQASTIKIEQDPNAPQARKDTNDWLQGYCYQMWRSRHNSYRADGAFGQFILIMPDQDAVVAITAETPDMQAELNLVWQHILPSMKSQTLPENPQALQKLKERLASLALSPPTIQSSQLESKVSGKTFDFASNEEGIESASLEFTSGVCRLTLNTAAATYRIDFGAGKWQEGETTRHGPYLVSRAKANRVGLPPFKTAASYTWTDETTLQLTLRYIESPHTETIKCSFEGEDISVESRNSFNRAGGSIYKGTLRK